MPNAYLTANAYFGLIKEVTRGVLPDSGTATFVPVVTPAVSPNQRFLRDDALRGSPGGPYDQVAGVRNDEFDHKFPVYCDSLPLLFVAILGSTDTVTGMTAPYTHVIGLLNDASVGSQPPSFSLLDFDGANFFTQSGAQASSVEFNFSADAELDVTTKWVTNPYVSYTSAPTVFDTLSISEEVMVPGWSVAVKVNGTTLAYVESGTLTLDRKTASIFTENSASPFQNFASLLEVTGKLKGLIDSDADAWSTGDDASALTRDQQALVIVFTDTNDSDNTVTLTMSSCQFQMPKRSVDKAYTEIDVDFTCNMNTTDAVDAGYAQISTSTVNSVEAAYN